MLSETREKSGVGWHERLHSEDRAAKMRPEANAVELNAAVNAAMKRDACRHDRLIGSYRLLDVVRTTASVLRAIVSNERATGPTASSLLDVVHAPDDDCRSALHCDHTSCRCHSPSLPLPPPPLQLQESHLFPSERRFRPVGKHESCVVADPAGSRICFLIWKLSYKRERRWFLI